MVLEQVYSGWLQLLKPWTVSCERQRVVVPLQTQCVLLGDSNSGAGSSVARCWDGSAGFAEVRLWLIKVGGVSSEREGIAIASRTRPTGRAARGR